MGHLVTREKVSRARGRTQQIVRKKGEEGTAATENRGSAPGEIRGFLLFV